jgi:hypothetical protein
MVGASKVSRYNYQAETLSNGKKVVLRRPARLKGGFDFVVRVPEHNFSSSGLRRRFEPKHDDIIQDLTKKKEIDACAYSALYEKLTDIFECRNVLDSEIAPLTQLPGLPNDCKRSINRIFF